MAKHRNNFPKIHNSAWPGLVGKGECGEPPIDLDTLLDLTADAEVDGIKFDGIDLLISEPHISVDSTESQLQELAGRVNERNLVIGTLVAPVWAPLGGGSAMGRPEERSRFLLQVEKTCRIGARLREIGIRPYGVVRIDSACEPASWAVAPEENQNQIASTFRQACEIAAENGERLAAEGEICWGGMHSWRRMLELLEMVDQPTTLGFQADLAHTLLFLVGHNAPEDALIGRSFDWTDWDRFYAEYEKLTEVLRPWTIDFHVAQNDATVFGTGSHDKTGRHCLPNDRNGKLDIPTAAGYWLRDRSGRVAKACKHICWDGCMFPNEIMLASETWKEVLACMIEVRDQHGWAATT